MSQIDVNTFIGTYPFRDIGAWDAATLVATCAAAGATSAWVSHLGAAYWTDPASGNAALYHAADAHSMLRPIPAVHPGRPGWESVLDEAQRRGVPAVRCDPTWYGLPPAGTEVQRLADAAGTRGIPVMMCMRLEDIRQRHPNDAAQDLPTWAVRTLIRAARDTRFIITHADRDFIEQVHFGSTPEEAERILWDISCIWGPPEDHLELLLRTVGTSRFTYGTGVPLRLAETAMAKIDLLQLAPVDRERLLSSNLGAFCNR
ncbi:MAG TPA: hypothetical protein VGM20_08055 [Gemmatimonadales bacterium]|jgi:hypothetical protein